MDNIATDMRNDVICGMIGSLIGAGTGGAAGALASGGAIAIPGAVIGAKEGAAIGIAISRTIKAGIRSSSRSSSSRSGPSYGGYVSRRTASTKTDADRYLRGLTDKRVLSDKKIARDGREYYEFMEKCEYQGIRFKKGEFIERDTQHHEWEYFQNKDTHLGAIDPLTGVLNAAKRQKGRTLKLR